MSCLSYNVLCAHVSSKVEHLVLSVWICVHTYMYVYMRDSKNVCILPVANASLQLSFKTHISIVKDAGVNRPFHIKRWNVESPLIKCDVTAGVHFSVILLLNYIAAYGKMRKLWPNSPFVQHIPVTEQQQKFEPIACSIYQFVDLAHM